MAEATKKLSPNAQGPCGSGKKYKRCCYDKGFHYLVDDDDNLIKAVPMHPEVAKELQEYMADFERKHGRPMRPNERLFSEDIWDRLVEKFREAGAPEAFCYAMQKTGVMQSPENQHLMAERDLKAFEDAMEEYERLKGTPSDQH